MSLRLVYIAIFGVTGVLARYYFGLFVEKHFHSPLPLATFCINISGAFLIGIVYVFGIERSALSIDLRVGIMVGLLGGFTTFSSYCLEAVNLSEAKEIMYALAYLGISPLLGFASTFAGMILARKLLGGEL